MFCFLFTHLHQAIFKNQATALTDADVEAEHAVAAGEVLRFARGPVLRSPRRVAHEHALGQVRLRKNERDSDTKDTLQTIFFIGGPLKVVPNSKYFCLSKTFVRPLCHTLCHIQRGRGSTEMYRNYPCMRHTLCAKNDFRSGDISFSTFLNESNLSRCGGTSRRQCHGAGNLHTP